MNRNHVRRNRSTLKCTSEALEQRCLLAADMSPWHNIQAPTDVNRDGYVSAIDALLVINEINHGAGALSRAADAGPVSKFVDVNNDFFVSAIDALLIINRINSDAANPQPNAASIPTSDSYTTDEDVPLVVDAANGVLSNDAAGTSTAVKLTNPAHGTVTLQSDGAFTYTPTADFFGSDSFTYAVNNGTTNSSPVTVTLTVQSVNDPPVAAADTYATPLNTQLVVSVAQGLLKNDVDVDGETLTVRRATTGDPNVTPNGSLQLNSDGSFIYTPNSGFEGQDTFRYIVRDASGNDSLSASVTINVGNVVLNNAPVAEADNYQINEDTVLDGESVLDNDTDVDGDSLTATVFTEPLHGIVVMNSNGTFTYTPTDDFFGSDTFEYVAFDGKTISQLATVTITILPVNDAPRGTNDSYSVAEDGDLSVAAPGVLQNDTDPEGSNLIASLVSTATHGLLVFNSDGSFDYTPNADFFGSDSFRYRVSDGTLTSPDLTVTLTVTNVNDAPVASLDAYALTSGSLLSIPAASGLLRNDSDIEGDALHPIVKDQPANGTLQVASDGSFSYTPTGGFTGMDSFTYTASDGIDESDPVTVRISVESTNSTVEFLLSTVDAAGQPVTTTPIGGSFFVQIEVQDLRALPTGVFQAFLDVFYDSRLVEVTGAPTFGADYPNSRRFDISADGIVNEAGALAGLQELGAGRKVLMKIPVQSLAPGIAVFAGDPRDLSPANDVLLFDTSTAVPISQMVFVPTSISIIDGVAPTAVNDTYQAVEDGVLAIVAEQGVLKNDTHPDNLPLVAVLVQGPQHGSVTLNANGSFEYRPTGNFNGSDSFTYVANDGTVNSNLATVTLSVASVDDAPVAQDNVYSVPGVSLTVNAANGVLSNDSDIDGDLLTAQLVTGPANGTLVLNADGSFTYTPRASFVGSDTFTYRAIGNGVQSNVATVTLNVDDLTPGSIAGFVYTDVNNDGIRGLSEAPIAGIVVTLQGVTASGQPILQTTRTAGDGSYRFNNVVRGSYTVIEDQPLFMIDGKDTFGGVESKTNDAISFDLPPGTNVTGVNFGEWGLLPDFARNGNLIGRAATGELIVALDNTGSQNWYCSSLWGFASVQAQLNSARTTLSITVTTAQGQSFTVDVPVVNNPRVQILGTRPEGLMIRLAGSAADFGFAVAALAARAVDVAFSA